MSGLVVAPGKVLQGVIGLLRAELPSTIPVGDSGAPDSGGEDRLSLTTGYVICDVLAGGPVNFDFFDTGGFFGAPSAMRNVQVQIVGYGVQPNQARWVAQRCIEIVLGWDDVSGYDYDLPVDDHSVIRRDHAGDVPADFDQQVHSAGHVVELLVTVDT